MPAVGAAHRAPHEATPKLAFGSWAFSFGPFSSNPWPFDRLCAYAADAGYDDVEINGFRPHPHHDDVRTPDQYRALLEMMEAAGVIASAYAPDFTRVPPAEVDADAYLTELDAARAFCEGMDIRVLRVDTVTPPDASPKDEYERRLNRLVGTWTEAARRCAHSGITLVWEFEPGFWLNRPSEVRQLVGAVGHPAFRILFDTSHAYAGAVAGARQGEEPELLAGGVAEYAELLRPYLGHLHLIDGDGSLHDDETSEHLPFGQGRIDFAAVLNALEPELSRLPWWGVDFCFCETTEADGRKAVPFLRDLIQTHGFVGDR
jgi:sugar phosphate isomerase/epimerase